MKRSLYVLSTLIIVIIALSIVHVVISNMLSTTGVELYALQEDLSKYKKENILLKEQVLVLGSLHYIASAAAELGFVPAKNTIYVGDLALPIARNR